MRPAVRHGFTLPELVVAAASSVVLLAGISSTLYIAGVGLQVDTGEVAEQVESDTALNDVVRDIQSAITITELTSTAITFTVPDRDGDSQVETIRYAWAGTAGDPLTYEYNGSAAVTIVDAVDSFQLDYLSRLIEGEAAAGNVIFISGGSLSGKTVVPTSGEAARIALMQSWGFTVNAYSVHTLPSVDSKEIQEANLVYVSGEANAAFMSTTYRTLTIGVISEQSDMVSTFLFAPGVTPEFTDTLDIRDNSHYITSPFPEDDLQVLTTPWIMAGMEKIGSHVQVLARLDASGSDDALVIQEKGDSMDNGRTVPGRRVALPWGDFDFDFNTLNSDGRTIMRRAMEWAAE